MSTVVKQRILKQKEKLLGLVVVVVVVVVVEGGGSARQGFEPISEVRALEFFASDWLLWFGDLPFVLAE